MQDSVTPTFVKRSNQEQPKVSLVLLDWSVRESFHLLHYLSKQTRARDEFEVIIIEYYDTISKPLGEFADEVDTWVTMNMPRDVYYHKHLMYNLGIALSKGEIVMIGDSDAMVRETFIDTIIRSFEDYPDIIFHIDQFRNSRRDLYPFCYPSFEEVLGEGCINNDGGVTAGIRNTTDPIHSRNYGACMCAKRDDLIRIGGADEHIDYVGHICGPYDMTFRLLNLGHREIWHEREFMFHTWHPGQAGANNYMGPHDGRHMSTTSLEALHSGRVMPFVENPVIQKLRLGENLDFDCIAAEIVNPVGLKTWRIDYLDSLGTHLQWTDFSHHHTKYYGYQIYCEIDRWLARPIKGLDDGSLPSFEADSKDALTQRIDSQTLPDAREMVTRAAPSSITLILIWRWFKSLVRDVLAHGYRALKFRDRNSLAALAKTILKLPRKMARVRRDISLSRAAVYGSLGSITVSLNHILSNPPGDPKTTILMRDRITHQFIENLKSYDPGLRIQGHLVHDSVELKLALDKLEADTVDQRLIVSTDIYSNFHETLRDHAVKTHLIVA